LLDSILERIETSIAIEENFLGGTEDCTSWSEPQRLPMTYKMSPSSVPEGSLSPRPYWRYDIDPNALTACTFLVSVLMQEGNHEKAVLGILRCIRAILRRSEYLSHSEQNGVQMKNRLEAFRTCRALWSTAAKDSRCDEVLQWCVSRCSKDPGHTLQSLGKQNLFKLILAAHTTAPLAPANLPRALVWTYLQIPHEIFVLTDESLHAYSLENGSQIREWNYNVIITDALLVAIRGFGFADGCLPTDTTAMLEVELMAHGWRLHLTGDTEELEKPLALVWHVTKQSSQLAAVDFAKVGQREGEVIASSLDSHIVAEVGSTALSPQGGFLAVIAIFKGAHFPAVTRKLLAFELQTGEVAEVDTLDFLIVNMQAHCDLLLVLTRKDLMIYQRMQSCSHMCFQNLQGVGVGHSVEGLSIVSFAFDSGRLAIIT
jgi:hypothetical protein